MWIALRTLATLRPFRYPEDFIMPRNTLKSFPTAILRRGVAHFHPSSSSQGTVPARFAAPTVDAVSAEPPRTELRLAAPPAVAAEPASDHTRSALEAVGAPAD